MKNEKNPVTTVATAAPETFLKTSVNSIARNARSPEENRAKNRLGSRSRRSQNAGIKRRGDAPFDAQYQEPLDRLENRCRDNHDHEKQADDRELAKIGLRQDLIDDDAGGHGNRQTQKSHPRRP